VRYQVWLTLESPLIVARSRATGNQLETIKWVPGATWRGALAAAVIASLPRGAKPENDSKFQTLFLDNRVRFGYLTANGEQLFPLSARICADDDTHRFHDLLLLRELGAKLPRTCGRLVAGGLKCTAKLTPHDGLVRLENGRPTEKDPPIRVVAHTAISNETLRVREEQFYTATAVERGTVFRGEVWVKDTATAVVFERTCAASAWLTLGRGRTRGHGHGKLQVQGIGDARTDVLEKLEGLNVPFAERNQAGFTVTLDSPCLVFNEWGLSRPFLTPADIAEAAGRPASELTDYELADWHSRFVAIGGWNAQAGLPKSEVLAIAPGSAFLFRRNLGSASRAEEYNRLAAILGDAAEGIGEKWAEGYGQARFCDSIHWKERGR